MLENREEILASSNDSSLLWLFLFGTQLQISQQQKQQEMKNQQQHN